MDYEITPEQIGDRYGMAAQRMIEAIVNHTEEHLYNEDGSPKLDRAEVAVAVDRLIGLLRHEASLIKDTAFEAYEINNADESQKELF